jgi:hypothetical protein
MYTSSKASKNEGGRLVIVIVFVEDDSPLLTVIVKAFVT